MILCDPSSNCTEGIDWCHKTRKFSQSKTQEIYRGTFSTYAFDQLTREAIDFNLLRTAPEGLGSESTTIRGWWASKEGSPFFGIESGLGALGLFSSTKVRARPRKWEKSHQLKRMDWWVETNTSDEFYLYLWRIPYKIPFVQVVARMYWMSKK